MSAKKSVPSAVAMHPVPSSRIRLSIGTLAGPGLCGLALLLMQIGGHALAPAGPLQYSGGFLIPGNYVVAGVDLTENVNPPDPVTGLSQATIRVSGVPYNADIVAAYLYFEAITVQSDPSQVSVKFRGQSLNLDDSVAVKRSGPVDLTGSTSTCWSSGTPLQMFYYKADVLRLLPVRKDANGDATVKYLVNDTDLLLHSETRLTVDLPTRSGNQIPEVGGATLVVVYVNPSDPLRKIVFYDGIYIQQSLTEVTTQPLQGFYKSAAAASAKVTIIGGSGQPNNKDRIFFNDGQVTSPAPYSGPYDQTKGYGISGVDPIVGGSSSQRSWSQDSQTNVIRDLTYNVSSLMKPGNNSGAYGETASISIDHGQGGSYDCLAFGGFVFSSAVADADPAGAPPGDIGAPAGDGIPDAVEDFAGGLKDPDERQLPDLKGMGSGSGQRDLFVEVNAFITGPTSYGDANAPYSDTVTTMPDPTGHHHMPTPYVLKLVGDAYLAHGIHAHFDVGPLDSSAGNCGGTGQPACYRSLGVVQHSEWTDDYTSHEADAYLIDTQHARGGEMITEKACTLGNPSCQFPAYPGTVAWKIGVQILRDTPVNPDTGQELDDDALINPANANYPWDNPATMRRRFDPARFGLFHYLLYAHNRAKPKSGLPCKLNGQPSAYPTGSTTCTGAGYTNNADFHVPSGSSGIADVPGGNGMVTLGRWEEFVGKPFVRASTTFHELGHNLNLYHGGAPPAWGDKKASPQPTLTFIEPNCKPDHLSAMSYLVQAFGLYDDQDNRHLDYSGTQHTALGESGQLADAGLSPAASYRPAWYAPATSALAQTLGSAAATRYCSGVKFGITPNPAMARVFTDFVGDPIDWQGDGGATTTSLNNQDVNFDGTTNTLTGFNDWPAVRLNLISAGRTLSVFTMASGAIEGWFGSSVEGGDWLGPGGDWLGPGGDWLGPGGDWLGPGGDWLGPGGDWLGPGGEWLGPGADWLGPGGDWLGPGGEWLGPGGDWLGPGEEIDPVVAKGLGRTPPFALKVCVITAVPPGPETGCSEVASPGDTNYHAREVTWQSPSSGSIGRTATLYLNSVFRKLGNAASTNPWVTVTTSTELPAKHIETDQLPDGQPFTNRTRATFDDGVGSPYTKLVTITADNDVPNAVNDPPASRPLLYTTAKNRTLRINNVADGVLANDTDVDSPDYVDSQNVSFMHAVLVTTTRTLAGVPSGTLTLNDNGTFTFDPQGGFTGQVFFTYRATNGVWSVNNTILMNNKVEIQNATPATVTITVTP